MKAMTAERCSGIKSGYWSAEKKEDLVQQLGLYEHQVLSPAKIEQFQKLRTRLKGAREIVELANECGRQSATRPDTSPARSETRAWRTAPCGWKQSTTRP